MRFRRRTDDRLVSDEPAPRLAALTEMTAREAGRRRAAVSGWPLLSPGSLSSWIVLVTTKPPQWRDPLLSFPEGPLAAGHPHEGWFYPDPIGFWAEVRRWVTVVARTREPSWEPSEALAVAALLHLGDEPGRLDLAREVCRPRVLLLLDEPAFQVSQLEPAGTALHHVPDPHRDGQVYQGWWGRLADGTIVGKAPQHPSTHRLYHPPDMDRFLAACPPD